ncbi:hypothetical protein [Hydrogenophaga sp. RWCD_12]|uniref:hypothetical protein n=1 Tax=Hydrogenophaga sp. RWCD_12 TaxID=3391190 RepID=UPI003984C998
MKTSLVALVVASAASIAVAQQAPYAVIKSVEGLVTVTSNNQLTNASANMPLQQGAEVLSTSNGKATIQFASGCTVTIQGGQSLPVSEAACTQFLAANPGAGAGAGGAGLSTPTKLLIGAAGLGVLYNQTRGGTTPAPAPAVVPPTPAPAPAPAAAAPAPAPTPPISGA